MQPTGPRILIIDDLLGRQVAGGYNPERADFCSQFQVEDVTGDGQMPAGFALKNPVARVVFCKGQRPLCARAGDRVENDLDGVVNNIRSGWDARPRGEAPWALVLVDLSFATGTVSATGEVEGFSQGVSTDADSETYFGLTVLDTIASRFPGLPTVVLSGRNRAEVSLRLSEMGALGFLARSSENPQEALSQFIWRHGLIPDESGEIAGVSISLLSALRTARRAAGSRRNLLIWGERGTGKELLARYVHRQSALDSPRPFVTLDCGALSPELYASELFGHRRGAFTGAWMDRVGRIKLADGGDLFMDEIGNLPADVQDGLLRVIEHHEITPLGARTPEQVTVRIVSATNESLAELAEAGRFRRDLSDRLREGGTIYLPPLRERKEDLEDLAKRFLREAEARTPGSLQRSLEPSALEELVQYDWPGNIRELRSTIFVAVGNYPDVEHMVAVHLNLRSPWGERRGRESVDRKSKTAQEMRFLAGTEALPEQEQSDWRSLKRTELVGHLHTLDRQWHVSRVNLLRAAIEATRKSTPDCPEGKILIHPAAKLITGDARLSASRAADIVKSILQAGDITAEIRKRDPVLQAAFDTAVRLRPGRRPRVESKDPATETK